MRLRATMSDEELRVEFETLLRKAALTVAPDHRLELFREYRAFRTATTLLRRDLSPHVEPSNVFRAIEFLADRRGR